ncbi:hypothetical protein J437_LFUL014151 [Ladona fulva]|uniref:15-hydroxyprostaglandin dehydrogenase [NAD(+)] n=1 Tax=Ladona fulva TaxID=123851 RepID=A0A8K0KHL4_LADFU|nr:hypothetical protein J437_LFUL014151 [Ladona fulva]
MSIFRGPIKRFLVSSPKIWTYGLMPQQCSTLRGSTSRSPRIMLNINGRLIDPHQRQFLRKAYSFCMNENGGIMGIFKENSKSKQQFSVLRKMHGEKHSSRMFSKCEPTLMEPKGKVAIITGGIRGLGLCMAEELLCLEAKVVLMDVDKEVGECAVEKLQCTYGKENSIFVQGDVTSCESFEHCFSHALCSYNRVDILVNNAGILNPPKWKDTIKINFNGVVNGIHLGLKYMGADFGKQGGVIINLASIVGHIPLGGAPVYSATKHGVIALTQGYADGFYFNNSCVRICAICPGVTETNMIEVKNLNMDAQQRDLLACQLDTIN